MIPEFKCISWRQGHQCLCHGNQKWGRGQNQRHESICKVVQQEDFTETWRNGTMQKLTTRLRILNWRNGQNRNWCQSMIIEQFGSEQLHFEWVQSLWWQTPRESNEIFLLELLSARRRKKNNDMTNSKSQSIHLPAFPKQHGIDCEQEKRKKYRLDLVHQFFKTLFRHTNITMILAWINIPLLALG